MMPNRIKTSWKVTLGAIALLGCGSSEPPTFGPVAERSSEASAPAPSDSSAVTPREVVLRFYRDFDAGKLDDFEALVAPEFKARVMGTQTLDWDGLEDFCAQFLVAFPDGRHEFDRVLVDGDSVVTIGHYRGTHEGVLMGMPATRRHLELAVMHVDRVVNGKLVEHQGIANGSDLMQQLGANRAEL